MYCKLIREIFLSKALCYIFALIFEGVGAGRINGGRIAVMLRTRYSFDFKDAECTLR